MTKTTTNKGFTGNGKNITITKGKLDLTTMNTATIEKVQLIADGINKMIDTKKQYKTKLEKAQQALEAYMKESYISSTEIAKRQEAIDKINKAIEKVAEDIKKAQKPFDECDKNLHTAYVEFMEDNKKVKSYNRAVAEWLDNAGITPAEGGIKYLIAQIGKRKASATETFKSGGTMFVGALKEKPFLDMWYREIATLMYKKNMLKEYTYVYKEAEEKKEEKVTANKTATKKATTAKKAKTATKKAKTTEKKATKVA